MNVLSIVLTKDELKSLENIEWNTNHLKELGLWEYAPKKQKGKVLRQYTVSLDRKKQPCRKGNNGMDLFSYFHLDDKFQFSN